MCHITFWNVPFLTEFLVNFLLPVDFLLLPPPSLFCRVFLSMSVSYAYILYIYIYIYLSIKNSIKERERGRGKKIAGSKKLTKTSVG